MLISIEMGTYGKFVSCQSIVILTIFSNNYLLHLSCLRFFLLQYVACTAVDVQKVEESYWSWLLHLLILYQPLLKQLVELSGSIVLPIGFGWDFKLCWVTRPIYPFVPLCSFQCSKNNGRYITVSVGYGPLQADIPTLKFTDICLCRAVVTAITVYHNAFTSLLWCHNGRLTVGILKAIYIYTYFMAIFCSKPFKLPF